MLIGPLVSPVRLLGVAADLMGVLKNTGIMPGGKQVYPSSVSLSSGVTYENTMPLASPVIRMDLGHFTLQEQFKQVCEGKTVESAFVKSAAQMDAMFECSPAEYALNALEVRGIQIPEDQRRRFEALSRYSLFYHTRKLEGKNVQGNVHYVFPRNNAADPLNPQTRRELAGELQVVARRIADLQSGTVQNALCVGSLLLMSGIMFTCIPGPENMTIAARTLMRSANVFLAKSMPVQAAMTAEIAGILLTALPEETLKEQNANEVGNLGYILATQAWAEAMRVFENSSDRAGFLLSAYRALLVAEKASTTTTTPTAINVHEHLAYDALLQHRFDRAAQEFLRASSLLMLDFPDMFSAQDENPWNQLEFALEHAVAAYEKGVHSVETRNTLTKLAELAHRESRSYEEGALHYEIEDGLHQEQGKSLDEVLLQRRAMHRLRFGDFYGALSDIQAAQDIIANSPWFFSEESVILHHHAVFSRIIGDAEFADLAMQEAEEAHQNARTASKKLHRMEIPALFDAREGALEASRGRYANAVKSLRRAQAKAQDGDDIETYREVVESIMTGKSS